jgi:hypothetical protein
MILRPTSLGRYEVIGECNPHGLSDSACLIGPLPNPWKVQVSWDSANLPFYRFRNSSSGEINLEDPRLGPLLPEWERIEADRNPDDPELFQRFKNKITGEVLNSDPRLLPDALKARGVSLKTFRLI